MPCSSPRPVVGGESNADHDDGSTAPSAPSFESDESPQTPAADASVPFKPASVTSFVLKRRRAGSIINAGVPIAPAGVSSLAHPSGVTPPQGLSPLAPSSVPSTSGPPHATAGRPGQLDLASLAILRVMCVAARQLLSLIGAVPKWTNVWIVLGAGCGSAASPFYGKIIDCASCGPDAKQSRDFCKDWWNFRGRKQGRRAAAKAAAAKNDNSDKRSDADGAGGGSSEEQSSGGEWNGSSQGRAESGSEKGDAASSDAAMYPPQQMLTRPVIKTIVGGVMGAKALAEGDLKKVLYLGGLEDVNQITYGDIKGIFSRAGVVLRGRCDATHAFSWARFCPLALLSNRWSASSFSSSVSGADFVPPNHRSSRGQTVRNKRLAVCVAAHLSPFYAKVFELHFAVVRKSGQKKRFRSKDPFTDTKKRAAKARKKRHGDGSSGKLTKAETLAAAAKARSLAQESKRAALAATTAAAIKTADAAAAERVKAASDAAVLKGDDRTAAAAAKGASEADTARAKSGGSRGGPMGPAESMPLCTLERLSAEIQMYAVWMREPTPVLPATTLLSVVSLTGGALSEAARASLSVRVVLPRELLKMAFAALTSADGAAPTPLDDSGVRKELAVQLNLGNHNPVIAFQTTLMQMSSVLAFNEAIESSDKFNSCLGRFSVSNCTLPAPLNFLSGQSVRVGAMAEAVRADIGARLLSDCVWACPRTGRLSTNLQPADGAFGGCSVSVQDVCDAGQRAFLTNALLDAGLAELQDRCTGASVLTGVLTCSQSASFTSIGGVAVDMPRALLSILEVLSSWGPSMEQFVMLVNIGNTHWVSATVSFPSRSVKLYDSLGGPSVDKSLIVSRLLLFARQAELRRRTVLPASLEPEINWTVEDEVNHPRQQDSHNCGLFAFAFVWCFVYGIDFASLPVVGDELRLSLLHFVLMCGRARAAPHDENRG